MNISTLFVRRPVLATVLAVLILFVGAISIFQLPISEYPEVDETVVTITTPYPGASPSLIQGFITSPIAEAVATTENIDYVSSSSRQSLSTVSVQMNLGADPDVALTEVLAKVQQVQGQLPPAAESPVIVKGTGQDIALMYLAVTNPNMNRTQLTEYLDRVIRPKMSTIEGVAEIQIIGASNYAMRIWIDPLKLAARDVTAAEISAAIQASNFLSAPGDVENEFYAYAIEMETTIQTAEAFGQLPLKTTEDGVVRLRDVADVQLASENSDAVVTFNGNQGTFIGVFPTPAANPLDTADAVLGELPALNESLPQGMQIQLVYDSTETIEASIKEVFKTIAEAVLIVMVVIFLFMGSLRSVLMPIATIPLSLIGICSVLLMMGYSINLLTLLAMVLAIGLVVDDAIVVVENIHRHIEEGLSPTEASIKGMKEITGPVIAMTLTLVAVLLPLSFTGGLTGSLFTEFVFALAGAVVISGIVALTITPSMSARILSDKPPGIVQRSIDKLFEVSANLYAYCLRVTLKVRWAVFLMVVGLTVATGYMFVNTPSELAPQEDSGVLFSAFNGPQYATKNYMQLYTDQISDLTENIEGVKEEFSFAGLGSANSGFYIWSLQDWADRSLSQSEIQGRIQGAVSQVTGLQAFVFAMPSLPGAGGGLPVSVVLQSIYDAERVNEVAEAVIGRAYQTGKFAFLQNSLSFDTPKVTVTIDRDRAASLNVPVSDIGTTLGLLVAGISVAEFDRDSNSYDIIMQVPDQYRDNPERIGEFFVRSSNGEMVPLKALVDIKTGASVSAIEQFNQLNSATIQAQPLPGVSSVAAVAELRRLINETAPQGFFIDYTGQSRLEVNEGNTILFAFAAALLVIYLVLAAQFESFRDPLIILMAVPLTIFGAIFPLYLVSTYGNALPELIRWLLGAGTLNIYTQVGLITLIGLISKHGILIVEFANQQRAQHNLSKLDAVVLAAKTRLRAILMTSVAMILAVVPLIIADGAGAASRNAMGVVIAFGLTIGTIFTLFVVPMFYTLISANDEKFAAKQASMRGE